MKVSNFTTDPIVAEWFLLWRYLGTYCRAQTIRGNFSAINNFFTKNNKEPEPWFKKNWKLRLLIQVVDRLNPAGSGSKPNTERFLNKLRAYFDIRFWSQFAVWSAYMLAYGFSLRSCEWSETEANNSKSAATRKVRERNGEIRRARSTTEDNAS